MGLVRLDRARPISFASAAAIALFALPPPPPLLSAAGLRSRALRVLLVASGVAFTWLAQKGARTLIGLF